MVRWTDHALAQLRHIHDYIAQDSPRYAQRVTDALVRKTFLLNELALYSYRILYEIKATQIDILAVIHKRQDLQADEIPREP